jgi:HlyD family secretion protein
MEKNKKSVFKKYLKKKRTWFILVFVILVLLFIFHPKDNAKNTLTDTVKSTDLKQTVLATGQVTSKTDLDLSFNSSGIVRSVQVGVGDKVRAGQTLATLDAGSTLGALTQARGALAAAQARLKRTTEGASNEEIALAQIALTNANLDYQNTKTTQATLVSNAYSSLLNSTPEAIPENGTGTYTPPTITGNYVLGKEGTIKITMYNSSNPTFNASGLVNATGAISTTSPQPIGNSGLYIQFPSNTNFSVSTWLIQLPNKKAINYTTNYNAYQSALQAQDSNLSSAQSLIDQRTAELALKKAGARSSDLDLANADIVTAQGQVQAAEAAYNNTVARAPADGTVTSIDVKIGELAQALKEAIVLQDISNIHLETNVNEANIANIIPGLPVDITFDAFGPDKTYKGTVTEVDPASTVISGVVNYKVTASVEKIPDLRPGMTANMTINIKQKPHVLVVPARAILVDEKGAKTVRVITDTKTKKYEEVPVTTGLEGDGGLTEVTSGLSEGEEIVTLIKTS